MALKTLPLHSKIYVDKPASDLAKKLMSVSLISGFGRHCEVQVITVLPTYCLQIGILMFKKYSLISILFAITIYSRCYDLNYPNAVVFDELHYGLICTLYFKNQFHFDKQPPLFNLVLSSFLPEKLLHRHLWKHVGQKFPVDIDLTVARSLSAFLGVVTTFLAYKTVKLLKFSRIASYLCVFLIVFDNSLIVQSRLMLGDSFLHVLLLLSINCGLKQSALCVFFSHVFLGLCLSTRWSSFSLVPVIFVLTFQKSWTVFINKKFSFSFALFKGILYLISFICIPVISIFVVNFLHVSLVSFSGPHDCLMSSAFQASLNGGLKSRGYFVTYQSTIYLRTVGEIDPYRMCYLKSNGQVYPIMYNDGRGSSAQQVVSCCHNSNAYSKFQVLHPLGLQTNQPVQNSDIILLKHKATGRFLNSHDIAAPKSKHMQEVSCYINYNMSFPAKFEWKVILRGSKDSNALWFNLHSFVLLQHVDTEAYLTVSGEQLPSWAGGCNEVVGNVANTLEFEPMHWNAEVVSSDANGKKSPFPLSLSAYEMTLEYMWMSFNLRNRPDNPHQFASWWHQWPFGSVTIAYWHDAYNYSQIYFTANIISWTAGVILCFLYTLYWVVLAIFQQAHKRLVSRTTLRKIKQSLLVLGLSWLFHLSFYIFTTASPTFIYQYLPGVLYLHILQSCAIEAFCSHVKIAGYICVILYMLCVLNCYWQLRPLTYGFSNVTKEQLRHLKLWDSWDFFL